MQRSTKDAWLDGDGDLAVAEVEDVPVAGMSVKVQALSARFSADVQAQLKFVQEGSEQVGRLDVAEMELLQFQHGVIEPQFTKDEVRKIQEKFGAKFRRVIAKIDEISGIDKAAITDAEVRFQAGEPPADGPDEVDAAPAGGPGPDVRVRAGAGVGDDAG